ncbi:MAG: hypothetical protein IPM79_38380 [Polyangiaceae bacterium]|jgi:hypothetical protein|nr:hypothetical protein [Polyangiaceae bacterium]MBK8943316.1 hypothetical protein [Polyangiaceae bacterium]
MKVRPSSWLMAALFLAACPKEETAKDEETTEKATSSTSTPTSTSTTASGPAPTTTGAPATNPTAATTESATKPAGIEARVKAEVDNKPDGVTDGTAVSAAAAKAAVMAPKGWNVAKGDVTVAKAGDEKARLAIAGFGAEGPDQRIAAAAQAADLKNCQWSTPPDTATVGKDKLTASVADGVCTRGTAQVKAAMMATEGLLVIGSWDDGGDMAGVFNAFRSVKKATVSDGIAACCAALRQNAKSAPPQQAGIYLMAAGACDNARKNPDTAAALRAVRGALAGANAPASCK